MELKHINSNWKIVLEGKPNPMEFFSQIFWKWVKKWIQYITFSRRLYNCPQNKKFYNFHITYPIGMNQSFYVDQNIFYQKKKVLNSLF